MKLIEDVREELGLTLGRMGKHRIMLFFDGTFSLRKKNRGIITLWLSGSPTSGEGDIRIYECPVPGCKGLLLPKDYAVPASVITCPKCLKTYDKSKIITMMVYDATVDQWATHLERYMVALGMDADIYLKRAKNKTSMVEAEAKAREGREGAELLKKARVREDALYTFGSIMEDVHTGRSLKAAIKSFLTS